MENNDISYRPFGFYRIISAFLMFMELIITFCAGLYISAKVYSAVFVILLLVVVAVILQRTISRYAAILVTANEQGIYITGEQSQAFRYVPWESILNGQYTKSFRNHKFLVLSTNPLTSIEAKKIANQSANKSQVFLNSNIVLCLNVLQGSVPLIEYIIRHVNISNTGEVNG